MEIQFKVNVLFLALNEGPRSQEILVHSLSLAVKAEERLSCEHIQVLSGYIGSSNDLLQREHLPGELDTKTASDSHC